MKTIDVDLDAICTEIVELGRQPTGEEITDLLLKHMDVGPVLKWHETPETSEDEGDYQLSELLSVRQDDGVVAQAYGVRVEILDIECMINKSISKDKMYVCSDLATGLAISKEHDSCWKAQHEATRIIMGRSFYQYWAAKKKVIDKYGKLNQVVKQ